MYSVTRIAIAVFLLSFALVSAYHNGAKLRRDGILNLYPFPRVGRASHRTWQVPLNDFYLEDFEPEVKRQLYAFPRVGRNDPSLFRPESIHPDQMQSPIRRTDSPGMWFGPRLGRGFKSDEDDVIIQNENERSEPEQMDPDHMERKKRQIRQL